MASRAKKRKDKKIPFNLMVVGKSGTGKSTFLRSFVEKDVVPLPDYDEWNDLTERTIDIQTFTEEIEGDDQKIALTMVDTPGFGENVNNSKSYVRILDYIENQHKRFLAEESRVVRNSKFQDTRIHAILYFIAPTGHQLQELDVVFMKKLAHRANILPVIGKADTLTPDELKAFKKRIMEDIAALEIPIFDFPVNSDDDEEIIQENKEFKSLLPFAIISSDDIQDDQRVRRYPWGTSVVSNESHCDFEKLALVLVSSHLEEFKDRTHNILYENYREENLRKGGVDSAKIEQELLEAEKLEKELKDKEISDRERRIALKSDKVKRSADDSSTNVASEEGKKKKVKPKKPEEEGKDDKDEEKKKKKKKKEGKEGEED